MENLGVWDTKISRIKSMPLNISGRGHTHQERGKLMPWNKHNVITQYSVRTEVIQSLMGINRRKPLVLPGRG